MPIPDSLYTKANVRTLVSELADDPDHVAWTAANKDLIISLVYDTLWSRMLELSPNLTSARQDLTSLTSPGYFTISTGLDNRFQRIHTITRNSQVYSPVSVKDVVIQGDVVKAEDVRGSYHYVLLGDQVHLLPYNTTDDVEVRYSYKPTRFTDIASDATVITWPDGHEEVLIYAAAARLLMRGDREDATQLSTIADLAWRELSSAIQHQQLGPIMPHHMNQPSAWGAE